jgi:DNA polymerase III subunit gamma/tau
MRKQAAEFGSERLARAAETISNGLVEMRGATSPRLLLELMCAQVLLPASAAPDWTASETEVGDLAARIERLERQLAAGGGASRVPPAPERAPPAAESARARPQAPPPAAQPAPAPQPAPSPQPAPAPQAASGGTVAGLSADELRSRWPDVLEAVRDVRKTAWILLSNYASIDTVEGNVLTMAFDSEGNAKGFASSGSDGYLAAVLDRMFGVRPVIRAIVNPAGGAGGGRGPARGPDSESGGAGRAAASPPLDSAAGQKAAAGNKSAAGQKGSAVSRRGSSAGEPSDVAVRAGSAGRRMPGSDLGAGSRGGGGQADDPRPFTDPVPDGGPDPAGTDLTGTDLIMRELGGRMIEES